MLTIYRASAGAGKTHKLTGEYLTLLFSQPGEYRRILAVTFTNKATDEMKGRIVSELYRLASHRPSDYLVPLSDTYHLSEQETRTRARKILIAILHDYSAFNISTIDRFFQQTMRAFTREIGLQGGYGIEMDQELVLTEAIDRLLASLDEPDNGVLLGWLLRFAEDKIEEGGSWSLRQDIQSLGRELFKESYKEASEELERDIADKEALESYKEKLFAIIRSVESEMKQLGSRGISLLNQFDLLPSDIKGSSRSPLFFFERLAKGETKAPTATFRGLADNLDGYLLKKMDEGLKARIEAAFNGGLNDCVRAVVERFDNLTDYYTAREIARYYYTLGILTDISRQVAAYREEKNVMLIADTTELLSKVIGGSDTPFIYEKTGTRIDHYMIDEFQDTSGMQWDNFRPLVEESLAHERANLIVGDVKQSIYRFRNSDWKLLDEQVRRDFGDEQVREETLGENWRSCRHIVEFNNALFTLAPAILQESYNEALTASSLGGERQAAYLTKIMSAYDRSFQRVAPPFRKREGHVQIDFLEGDDEGGSDWKEEALRRLPEALERLQDKGYSPRDIAILVRTNNEGAQVASRLLAYKEEHPSERYRYDIISDEALFVGSSPAVRFLLATLRYLRNPDDRASRELVWYAYLVLTGHFGEELPDTELFERLAALNGQSLYETVEGLFRLFADYFPEPEQVFVQAFLDLVSEYGQKESPDLSRFLGWWDESGHRKTIATPDGQDAIRILTVHKSKGLGFKVVILPFCDWEIDHKPTKPVILWCRPEGKPFDKLRLVPVRYGQGLGQTLFAADYFKERLHAFIDNLNTLYVAFTRSKEELVAFAPRPGKLSKEGQVEKVTSIADLLWAAFGSEAADTREGEPLISLAEAFDPEAGRFELGADWHPEARETEAMPQGERIGRLRSISSDDRLRLRLVGRELTVEDTRRKHGTLMHEVLSRVRVADDVPGAVERYRLDGVIDREEAEELTARLSELLARPDVATWYDGSARVLNEVDILFGKGLSKRPDRVLVAGDRVTVIDYKFGDRKDRRHKAQVREYLELIRQMGYSAVTGYLWYVELGETMRVD